MAENYDFGDYRYQPLNFDIGGGGGGFTGTGGIGFQAPSIPDVGPGYNAGSYTPLDFSNLYAGGGGGFQLPQGAIPDLGGFQAPINIPGLQAPTGANIPGRAISYQPLNFQTVIDQAVAGNRPKFDANVPTEGGDKASPDFFQRASKYFDERPLLAKLLGGGLTAGLGSIMGARGQAAAGRLQKDIGKLGATQREEGQRLVAAAQRGELTAPQQQQLEAFRAQQAQALSSRGITGGTAAQQLDAQIENMRQQLLQQNLQTGLALLQVGDQYTQQAISAGYNADQTAQNTAGRFYSAALQALGAMPAQQQTQPTRTP